MAKLFNGEQLLTEGDVFYDETQKGWCSGNLVFLDADKKFTLVDASNAISMRQARLELLNRGLLDDVELAISGLDRAAQIEWEYAVEVKRDYPLVLQLAAALNMTDADMDTFFESAGKL